MFKTLTTSGTLTSTFAMLTFVAATVAYAAPPTKLSPPNTDSASFTRVSTPANPANARAVFLAKISATGPYELWSTPIAGGSAVNLSGALVNGGAVLSYQLSKDGVHAVFRADKEIDETFELYSVPIDGSALPVKRSGTLVSGGDVKSYEIGSTSQRVVYIADKTISGRDELWSVPIATGSGQKIAGSATPGRDVTSFRISPNALRVVFMADFDASDVFELYTVDINNNVVTKISKPLVSGGAISDDYKISTQSTSRVAYRADADTLGKTELYSVSITGGATTTHSGTLVAGGDVKEFAFSPSASDIVFRADKDADGVDELFSVWVGGTPPIKISGPVALYGEVEEFQISPDSSRAIYKSSETGSTQRLYSAPLTGNPTVPLCSLLGPGDSVFGGQFAISADSMSVAFVARVAATSTDALFSAPINGGSCVDLSAPMVAGGNVDGDDFQITLDSKRVVFTADKDTEGVTELYSVPIAGGMATKISGELVAGGDVNNLTISADSKWVAFIGDKSTNNVSELYAVALDGGGPLLDIDGDGQVLATTDLLMVTRYQLGIRGAALITNAVSGTATRTTFQVIEDYLRRVMSAPSPL